MSSIATSRPHPEPSTMGPTSLFLKDKFPYAGGRYKKFHQFSGELLRETIKKLLREFSVVNVFFDDSKIYSSSFLEEAFGGLIRSENLSLAEVIDRVRLRSNKEIVLMEINEYLKNAEKVRLQRQIA